MPRTTELPDVLQKLARRNALDISDTRFHQDVDRLIEVLGRVLRALVAAPSALVAAPTQPTAKVPEAEREVQIEEVRPPVASARPANESAAAWLPFEPEMISIPAGEFLMGSDPQKDGDAEENEQPQHPLYLPDYYLAKTPVTNAQFAAFVKAVGWQAVGTKWAGEWAEGKPPLGKADYPVDEVTWAEAMAYCRWLSGVTGKAYSLPSETEWEKGARGEDGRIYPWATRGTPHAVTLVKVARARRHPWALTPEA